MTMLLAASSIGLETIVLVLAAIALLLFIVGRARL